MPIQKIDPPELAPPFGYAHVVIASGTRRVYIAGQTGTDASGALVAPDLAGQTTQALRNLLTALAAAGATIDDVVKLNFLVVGFGPDTMNDFLGGASAVFPDGFPTPATTLYGVQSLFDPAALVEVDAIAELD
jgi:enamine deaminase RidA (YjgF/YER057c/UK114 family)